MKLGIYCFGWALGLSALVVPAQEAAKDFFPGGVSDISGADPKRAEKAIQKWSDPNGKQNGVALSGHPFYWDASRVGRQVFLRIIKNDNRKGRLELWTLNPNTKVFDLYKTYRIFNFSGKLGPKMKQGDMQAPEGFYYVSQSRLNPNSSYHLSMDIGYPNAYDREHDRTGNHLMIHGSTPSLGCFAMTDCSIEQIYTMVAAALANGQKIVRVHSFPFEMTAENLANRVSSDHYSFWKNLKQGWDWFEQKRTPPNVEVREGRYTFSDLEQ